MSDPAVSFSVVEGHRLCPPAHVAETFRSSDAAACAGRRRGRGVAHRLALTCAFVLGSVVAAHSALAQYPARPIEMIVPIAPGGGMDLQARLLAELVEPDLGQRVVILNRAGAGGTLGMTLLTQAKPDGYTIGAVWSGPLTSSPHSQPVQYSPDDYIPVIQFSKAPFVMCTAPDFPAATGQELVANIRQNPDKYTYGHEGIGGTLHLGAERAFGALGLKVRAVPFAGAADTARNFMGGHITFYAGGIASILPQVKAGKAKCLLLTSAANNPLFPQAIGLDALGVGNMETVFWRAIVVPKGTPPEIVAKLEASFLKAAQRPKFLEYLAGLGEVPSTTRGPALARDLRAEYDALGALTRQVAPK
ncbi:MAG: tripartite tricarboxylate transporter substrate binding protein [Betaproteobacteria bacterium]|nr:tripartite tricarboxylate transporter substrate binding protein [Betaproteobacteria bacterium]MBK9608761.1 tripartite tricarboxylate transporter substrate binding protein [Betaproteobacteria bacterium]